MRRSLVIAALLTSTVFLAACENTIRGAGRDISNTADATGAAARDIAQ
ncbi:hypothetical protein [Lutibaculum baratangense]|uniref:Entericidin EcnAB n=1 Tax=Lutibaculum baratangense AMV1 TaxID=631454 RepID=V4R2B0_9HYPH|nr:hypothetical protein [Lutibaculum baratangense]ESR26087.1 hypothetical protein N177_1422 [Lutibaculum baratangense AMV1]